MRYIGSCIGTKMLHLKSISCEKDARLDIILTFIDESDREVQVGIEAKVNHSLTQKQLEKERDAVDALIILVLKAEDAADFKNMVNKVVTWAELLSQFDKPRITVADIYSLPAQKVQVERILRKVRNELSLPEGWQTWVGRGDSAMPGITFVSPPVSNGSNLCGQIQVTGRSMPTRLADVMLEFYVGTQVEENDEFYPAIDPASPPVWVTNARTLFKNILHGDATNYRLKTRAPGTSKRPLGPRRKELTNFFLRDAPWLAQGYIDWCAGVRCHPRPLKQASDLATDAIALATQWWDELSKR